MPAQKSLFKPLILSGGLLALIGLPIALTRPTASQPPSTRLLALSPTPTPTSQTQTINSGDGKVQLAMTQKSLSDSSVHQFTIVNNEKQSRQIIYTNNLNSEVTHSLSINAWSPDNQLFFIQENSNGNSRHLVFKASGDPFASDLPYLDVDSRFAEKLPNLTLREVTGWASNTLLIVYTTKSNGDKGPSYWFDTTSQSFIQLAH